jgi:hypothetical protein
MNLSKVATAVLSFISAASPSVAAETLIPSSRPGDKGAYYLLSAQKVGGITKTLHKRVGVDSVGWTRCEIDCGRRLIRNIGYSEIGPASIKEDASKWYELVQGSSKSDLVNFVCRDRN